MGAPINPVLSGMMRGAALAQQMREMALAEEREQRAQLAFEQQQQMQELDALERIQRNTRPVTGGMVSEQLPAPKLHKTDPDASMEVYRPVDTTRLARYKTRDGRVVEGEILSRKEQADRDLEERVEAQRVLAQQQAILQAEAARQMREAIGGTLPELPGVRLLPSEMDEILRERGVQQRHQETIKQQQNVETGRNTRAEAAEAGRNQRARESREALNTREGMREAGRNARAAGRGAGNVKWEATRLQSRINALQSLEDRLHLERRRIGAELRSGKLTEAGAADRREKLAAYQSQIEDYQKRKAELVAEKDALYQESGQSGGQSAPDTRNNDPLGIR